MNFPTIICSLFALFSLISLFIYKKNLNTPYLTSLFRGAFLFFTVYLITQVSVFIRWEFFIEDKASDTAHNYSFITGAVFALFFTFLFLVIDLFRTYFNNKTSNNTTIH